MNKHPFIPASSSWTSVAFHMHLILFHNEEVRWNSHSFFRINIPIPTSLYSWTSNTWYLGKSFWCYHPLTIDTYTTLYKWFRGPLHPGLFILMSYGWSPDGSHGPGKSASLWPMKLLFSSPLWAGPSWQLGRKHLYFQSNNGGLECNK